MFPHIRTADGCLTRSITEARAPGHDHDAEDQSVNVDHPLDGRDVDVEVVLDARQGDAHRREVVGHDEHGHRHRAEGHQRTTVESGHSQVKVPLPGDLVCRVRHSAPLGAPGSDSDGRGAASLLVCLPRALALRGRPAEGRYARVGG